MKSKTICNKTRLSKVASKLAVESNVCCVIMMEETGNTVRHIRRAKAVTPVKIAH